MRFHDFLVIARNGPCHSCSLIANLWHSDLDAAFTYTTERVINSILSNYLHVTSSVTVQISNVTIHLQCQSGLPGVGGVCVQWCIEKNSGFMIRMLEAWKYRLSTQSTKTHTRKFQIYNTRCRLHAD
jgi:hypothetical protein